MERPDAGRRHDSIWCAAAPCVSPPPTPRVSVQAQLKQPISTLSGGRHQPAAAGTGAGPARQSADPRRADQRPRHGHAGAGGTAPDPTTHLIWCRTIAISSTVWPSTIALNGRGDVVETPGGWQDFLRQNPASSPRPDRADAAPSGARQIRGKRSLPDRAPKTGQLSYRTPAVWKGRKAECSGTLPVEIARQDAILADPDLCARDPPPSTAP